LEWGILSELGIVDEKTVVATTVHDIQVLDILPPYMFQHHDLPVDIICTPAQTIRIRNRRSRPSGIDWNLLSREFFDIPVIRDLQRLQRHRNRHFELNKVSNAENGSAGSCASSGGSDDSSDYTTQSGIQRNHAHEEPVAAQTLAELEQRMAQLESIFGSRLGSNGGSDVPQGANQNHKVQSQLEFVTKAINSLQ
jgi:hypothetical protein